MNDDNNDVKRGRSPNYPAISLKQAVEGIAKLYSKIHRHPAPREAVATSLGYSGLHGSSMSAISALVKYGFLEKLGDDLKLTERAMQIIAPHTPEEKQEALRTAANAPALFNEMLEHFKGDVPPSDDLIRSYLIRRNFVASAVPQVIQSFRETMELVAGQPAVTYATDGEKPTESIPMQQSEIERETPRARASGERELATGLLSKNTTFRLLVSGNVGVKEIDRLIAKLKMDKDILAEQEGDDGQGDGGASE
jgi:hypothetical protein